MTNPKGVTYQQTGSLRTVVLNQEFIGRHKRLYRLIGVIEVSIDGQTITETSSFIDNYMTLDSHLMKHVSKGDRSML